MKIEKDVERIAFAFLTLVALVVGLISGHKIGARHEMQTHALYVRTITKGGF